MLLNKDKRVEVLLVDCYRGLKLFQTSQKRTAVPGLDDAANVPGLFSQVQHAPTKKSGVRELALK